MKRRGFIQLLLAAPLAAVGVKRGWKEVGRIHDSVMFEQGFYLTRTTFQELRSNIYATPRVLTEKLMREAFDQVRKAR